MSSERDNRGSAFPAFVNQYDYGFETERPATVEYGMTLRDYFAAHAPNPPEEWMPTYRARSGDLHAAAEAQAIWRNLYADAMLEARKA